MELHCENCIFIQTLFFWLVQALSPDQICTGKIGLNRLNFFGSKVLSKNSVYFEELGVITDKDMIINDKTKVTIDELKLYNTNWLTKYMSS